MKKRKQGFTTGYWFIVGIVVVGLVCYLAAFTLSATGQVFEPCVYPQCAQQIITCQWPNRCAQ